MDNKKSNHIDTNLQNVFHFLELKGNHAKLIGSQNIIGMLYAKDNYI